MQFTQTNFGNLPKTPKTDKTDSMHVYKKMTITQNCHDMMGIP